MGDVFDNLFSIIPIVLAILWILRRASKRKSKAAQAQKPATAPVAQAESESGRSRLSEGLHILEAKAAKAIRNEVSPSQPRVEEIQYEKLETRPINVPDATPVPVQGERLLDKRDVPATGKKYSGPETSDSFDRFRKLSPLAQGMVWSIILEEPLALKEPDTSHEA
jgi:hypothetical protein